MHPAIAAKLKTFEHVGLTDKQREVVAGVRADFQSMANIVAAHCSGPDATIALNKLLEAKDAAIRAIIFGG